MILELLVGGGVVLGLLSVKTVRRTVWRIGQAAGAQFNLLGIAATKADPAALMQKYLDDAQGELRSGVAALEKYKGEFEVLKVKVDERQREVNRLEARAQSYANSGRDELALAAIKEKNALLESLESMRRQLKMYEDAYEGNRRKVQVAHARIEEQKAEARRLSVELKMSETEKQLQQVAAAFSVNTSSLNALSEVRDEMQRQIAQNRAGGQVAAELGFDGTADVEADEDARTRAARDELARLKGPSNGTPQITHREV